MIETGKIKRNNIIRNDKFILSCLILLPATMTTFSYYFIHLIMDNYYIYSNDIANYAIKLFFSLFLQFLMFFIILKNENRISLPALNLITDSYAKGWSGYIFSTSIGFVIGVIGATIIFYSSTQLFSEYPVTIIDLVCTWSLVSLQTVLAANVVLQWNLRKFQER